MKEEEMQHQDRTLTLMHLRKTYGEFCRTPNRGRDQDAGLQKMLPLWLKVRQRQRQIRAFFCPTYHPVQCPVPPYYIPTLLCDRYINQFAA